MRSRCLSCFAIFAILVAPALPAPAYAVEENGADKAKADPADADKADKPASGEKPGEREFLGCQRYPPDKRFRWSVRGEVGVPELVASLGQIACQPIVVGVGVVQRGGKVQLQVPDLVTAGEVYHLFYAALEVLGLTVERTGKTLKVVDGGRAKEAAALELGAARAAGDQFVLRLWRPRHAAPSEVAELLGKLKSKEGEVSVTGGALVLLDRAGNVARMEQLANALDVAPPQSRLYLLTTHGQTPTELAATLEKVLGSGRRPTAGGDPKARGGEAKAPLADDVRELVPVDAAGRLVVIGSDSGWERVQALAARLDPPSEENARSQAHVIQLSHTNAEDMVATLQSIGVSGRGGSSSPRPSTPPGGPAGAPPPSSSSSSSSGASSTTLPLSGEVRIGADKTSNTLVIFANGADFITVRDLVARLDQPRRQVYVEAVILDLSVDHARTLGVSFHSGAANNSGTGGFAVSGSSTLNSVALDAKSVAGALGTGGLVAGVLGSSFKLFGQDIPSFGVLVQALEHSKDVNVLSRPHLLTMDNTKASLSVGQNIVFQTSSLGSVASSTSLLANYSRQKVALTLELTPHLNDSDSIRLEIDGTIEDVADTATNQPGGPTTNQRTLKTAVVVRDGEAVVLGGLQKESSTETVDKIPFLGDIPLLGRLFQTRGRSRVKQDLLILMTPFIIRGPEDLRRIQERKDAEHREFIERYSAFADESHFEIRPDYRRKRGLLEEINRTAALATDDAAAHDAAARALRPRPSDGPL